jgi:cytochrome c556
MQRNQVMAAIAFAACSVHSASVFAQAKPETQVLLRQSVMNLNGKYMYSMIPMAQGKIPYDAKIVQRNVGFLDALTQMPWDNFGPETANTTMKTRAAPEIWKDQAGFQKRIEAMRGQMQKLDGIVKTGNEQAIKDGIVETNKVCNACHDTFRSRS